MNTAADLIRSYLDAFNRADRPAMLALLTEDVAHDINQGGRETGRDAFAAFMARMDRCYRERLVDIVVMMETGGSRAAAEFVVEGEYLATDEGLPPATGQRYRLPAGAFYEIRGGRIARVTMFYNLQDWVRQVEGRGE
ncbi:ketosteroid isomerase-related protein [Neoroseomonas soli]|uniref:ketosteroid isomerase-related protein n=1 Tax=Neoroseomonas soli TaxID=1081025 RepID=UPI0038D0F5C4